MEKKKQSGYFQRTISVMVTIYVSSYLITYTINVILAQLLSPEDYGNYKIAENFFDLASIPVLMGGATAALKFLPIAFKESNLTLIWEYTRFYLITILTLSFLLALITFSISINFLDNTLFGNHHPIAYATAIVPIMAIIVLIRSILQSKGLIYTSFIPKAISYPILQLGFILALYAFVGKLTVSWALMIAFTSLLIILCYLLIKGKQLGIIRFKKIKNPTSPLIWLKVSITMMLLSILHSVLNQIDLYMIEIFGNEDAVGYFATAQVTVMLLFSIQSAFMIVFNPLITLLLKEDMHNARKLNAKCFRLLLAFILPIGGLLFLFSKPILSIFGHNEPEAATTLQILVPGYLFSAMFAIPYSWLKYSGQEKNVTIIMFACLTLNIILNGLLIPNYGIQGAAIATTAMFISTFIALCIMVKKHLGFYPWSRVGS
ncbi:flippase [Shewanella surugensis]|uniref:Flippase n=1 Tax=Shewanella surugensis TaxID=212020 RepID=A0ABT0LJE7_9GAMM|nr:flippase [Shewanella surugensis]MCL1127829.1 flippase [Shewanella surugensis]